MDLDGMLNVIAPHSDIGQRLVIQGLAYALYYSPSIITPFLTYKFANIMAIKDKRINLLNIALITSALTIVPLSALVGLFSSSLEFLVGNCAGYAIGATALTAYHKSKHST